MGYAGTSVVVDCHAAASGSSSITVPTGTRTILLQSTFWRNGTFNLTSVDINGVSATIHTNRATTSALNHVGVSYISDYTSTEGSSVNLNYVWSGAPTEGGLFIVTFYDTVMSVDSVGTDAQSGGTDVDASCTTGGTEEVIGFVEAFSSHNPNGTPSGSDQTILHSIDDSLVNSDKVDLVVEGTTDTPNTHITGSNCYYSCAAAVALSVLSVAPEERGDINQTDVQVFNDDGLSLNEAA